MARTPRVHCLSLLVFLISMAALTSALWTMDSANHNQHYKSRDQQLEEMLSQGEEKCINKPCVQSEQCCPGSVCVDLHATGRRQVTGTCLPIYGVNEGEFCTDDNDCEPGLRCLNNQITPLEGVSLVSSSSSSSGSSSGPYSTRSKTCQPPGQEMLKKQYNDECSTSSECDASRGLCCQLIKRHRMAPRKACLYFSDPKICIGAVDVTFAKPANFYYYTPSEHDYFRARIG